MTEVDIDVGRKRRLPVWMLGVSAADELKKSGNDDESCLRLQDQSQPQAPRRKEKTATRKSGKRLLTQETNDLDEASGSLLRCETRERTRKSSKQDVDPKSTSCSEAALQKKKTQKRNDVDGQGTVRERPASKKLNSKINGPESSKYLEALLPTEESEDDIELTVEDLMSIAEEYVNADKEKQLQPSGTREFESEAHILGASIFSNNSSNGSFGAAGSGPRIAKCTSTAGSSHLTGTGMDEKESPALESAPANISRTGDAAQDMLDLFLGPLLKKPPIEERKFERTTTEDMALACELGKQVRSGVGGGLDLPLAKKKSSLKDKVAMFLA